jgi:hypothetical protein
MPYLAMALAVAGSVQAQTVAPDRPDASHPDKSHRDEGQCFFITQFEGWRAADDKTVYIRVGGRDIYRLGMAGSCPELTAPDAHLITKTRGPDTICSAIDWDLSVSESGPRAFPTPCIVGSMQKLSPSEAAELPKKLRP